MTSQTSNPPAACSVEYKDEFQHILILIYWLKLYPLSKLSTVNLTHKIV